MGTAFTPNRNQGFGIVDLLIGFALLGVLTTLTAQLLTRMNLGAAQAAQKDGTSTIVSTAKMLLGDPTRCTQALKGQIFDAANVENPVTLYSSTGAAFLKADPAKFSDGVSLKKIYLRVTDNEPTFATVHLVVSRTALSTQKEKDDDSIKLQIDVDPVTKQIKQCAPPASADNYCYASRAERFTAPSCMRNYHLKALTRTIDDDWDGVGAVCCFDGTKDNEMEALLPSVQSGLALRGLKIVPSSIGKTYNDLVMDCATHHGAYGESDVHCPRRDDADEVDDTAAPTATFAVTKVVTSPANCVSDCTMAVWFSYTATDNGGLEALKVAYNSGDDDIGYGKARSIPLNNGSFQTSFTGQVKKLVIPMVDAGQTVTLKLQIIDNAGNIGEPTTTVTVPGTPAAPIAATAPVTTTAAQ